MESRLDDLFQEWGQSGAAVLVAGQRLAVEARPAEQVLAESTALCRDSARLTWIVVEWLRTDVDDLDEQALLTERKPRAIYRCWACFATWPMRRRRMPGSSASWRAAYRILIGSHSSAASPAAR